MISNVLSNVQEQIASIAIGAVKLQAELVVPLNAHSIIIFAHGNGIERYSTRNRYLAHVLRQTAGVGTVLVDLLTREEAIDLRSKHCSSVQFLAKRLIGTLVDLSETFLYHLTFKITKCKQNTKIHVK